MRRFLINRILILLVFIMIGMPLAFAQSLKLIAAEGFNPLKIVDNFMENPVVTRLNIVLHIG